MEVTTKININDETEGEDDAMSKLYEASMEGSVSSLNWLMQKDRLILSKISLTTFSQTPLHISSLLGHTHFSQILLDHQPVLAFRLDSRGRSPLHLASANGHVDTVRALLRIREQFIDDQHMCLVKDGDGRIALHYAAMRGHVGAVELLVAAQPKAVLEGVGEGETVLHLCVRYNQLESLRLLVESPSADSELLNAKDNAHGNTVLHLAVMLNQIQTVKYLLSVRGLKQDISNHKGLKASDLVDDQILHQTDYTTHKLKLIMKKNPKDVDYQPRSSISQIKFRDRTARLLNSLYKEASCWLQSDQMRGSILVVAGLIAQTTFQTAFNPPGGVWQESFAADPTKMATCTKDVPCIAGTSVQANIWPDDYLLFLKCNTVSFLAALSIIILLVGGVPLSNKLFAWLMTVSVLVTLTFMAVTYLIGMDMVAPENEVLDAVIEMLKVSLKVGVSLLAFIGFYHTVFLLVWLHKKSCRLFTLARSSLQ